MNYAHTTGSGRSKMAPQNVRYDFFLFRVQRSEQNGPTESPGLDDFAHMGLINDLLE
jgi:hypothetical protein